MRDKKFILLFRSPSSQEFIVTCNPYKLWDCWSEVSPTSSLTGIMRKRFLRRRFRLSQNYDALFDFDTAEYAKMSAKAIWEVTGKALLNNCMTGCAVANKFAEVTEDTDWDVLTAQNPWLLTEVSKPHFALHVFVRIQHSFRNNSGINLEFEFLFVITFSAIYSIWL